MHLCCRKQPSQEQQHTSRHSCRTCSIPTQSPSLPTALQHASRGKQIIRQPGTSSCHWQQKAYPSVQSCYDCNFYLYNLIICGIFIYPAYSSSICTITVCYIVIIRSKWHLPVDNWCQPGQHEELRCPDSRCNVLCSSSSCATWEEWDGGQNS